MANNKCNANVKPVFQLKNVAELKSTTNLRLIKLKESFRVGSRHAAKFRVSLVTYLAE